MLSEEVIIILEVASKRENYITQLWKKVCGITWFVAIALERVILLQYDPFLP